MLTMQWVQNEKGELILQWGVDPRQVKAAPYASILRKAGWTRIQRASELTGAERSILLSRS